MAALARTNRLIREKSPYLLQHARNPVAWYPWGDEALAAARRDQKLIFLSIGYSTCHWCHVMERESFEDPAVAALLNAQFIAIKVDREERPDLDHLYMQAVMSLTGQGGWPLTVFLTPELQPVFGGTYFPPEERWGRPGLKQVLTAIATTWAEHPEQLRAAGDSLTKVLRAEAAGPGPAGAPPDDRRFTGTGYKPVPGTGTDGPGTEVLAEAVRQFTASFDPQDGGFGDAPKFPRSHALSFLLRAWARRRDPAVLAMVERTLQAMAAGGLHDHLGGGFHRYSTDAQWRIPHFEKMLYDQALLARTSLEAYQATGRSEYADVARDIFDYVLRDLTGPDGAFSSAEDADSAEEVPGGPGPPGTGEQREGAFYLWTQDEIGTVLGPSLFPEVMAYLYGVKPGGNAAEDPTGEFKGKNILYRAHTIAEAATHFRSGTGNEEIAEIVARARRALFDARAARPRPHLDDKVLTDWNGLMLASLAYGARVLDEPRYRAAAERAAQFLLTRMVRRDGRLLHRYRDGEVAILGMHDDYAFLIHGLVELYQATFEPRYLAEAQRLTAAMLDLFWDEAGGGFFLTGRDAEPLLVRPKTFYDGAIPAGNSVAALELLRLGRVTGAAAWEARARRLLQVAAAAMGRSPTASPQMLIALDFAVGPSQEVVIAGPPGDPKTQAMVRAVSAAFLPNAVLIFHPPGRAGQAIEAVAPWVAPQGMTQGRPTAYVCSNDACQQPVTDADALRQQLASATPSQRSDV
ncbi:MAG: thioredoxin domain-containing protein [Candidatus Omnitrophica bacterium]|nr:thioredoxin domain-containing protein [Candidatus Omnitrophota bacterium]